MQRRLDPEKQSVNPQHESPITEKKKCGKEVGKKKWKVYFYQHLIHFGLAVPFCS
jgi:hypothetical protein